MMVLPADTTKTLGGLILLSFSFIEYYMEKKKRNGGEEKPAHNIFLIFKQL